MKNKIIKLFAYVVIQIVIWLGLGKAVIAEIIFSEVNSAFPKEFPTILFAGAIICGLMAAVTYFTFGGKNEKSVSDSGLQ